ncbi:hypothetical protein [Picosynechococcus sp. NKBG15041c]|uniref:hypothetical protein n=1 Tax=Picosynechococcus sp. NKBG15041c TaxID=1407650 RepID=UPI00130D8132|nr:hypothetical protein [Picosynechococcus sp. NKBG15041c]
MARSKEAAIAFENATYSTIMPDMPPPELVIKVVYLGRARKHELRLPLQTRSMPST